MQRDEAVAAAPSVDPDQLSLRKVAEREARRVRHGLRHPANWFQLVRFSIVGGSGYVVNLSVYVVLVTVLGVHYLPAAVLAFCVAVTNNFLLNRHWTFKASHGRATFQAPRFLVVSLIALVFNLVVLELLVGVAGVHEVVGQATAILAATPLNFIGNKLWSFGRLGHRPATPPARS
jgi:dolichol-phosphate mannosyltransferase